MTNGANVCGLLPTVAALAGLAMGQSKPKDVDGWGKVKWGMTLTEARTVYGAEAKESTAVPRPAFRYLDKLTIEKIQIGDMNAKASLQVLHGSDKISQVTLSFPEAEAVQSVRNSAYETIKALLIQKYGAPANEDRKPEGRQIVRTILWTFPSTSIVLRSWEDLDFNLGFVDVRYTATDKKATDAL